MSTKLAHNAVSETTVYGFLSRQLLQFIPPVPPGMTFTGKTAIVTGSNTGLGFSCAEQLLALDLSHLIIAVRSQSRGDAAAEPLRRRYPQAEVEVRILDMSSPQSVRSFVDGLEDVRVDVAILNAGLTGPYTVAPETGDEMTLQVNFLSTSLLSLLLLPVLKRSRTKKGDNEPVRLVIVGSDTSYWASMPGPLTQSIRNAFHFDDNPQKFDAFDAYKKTKLLLASFTNKLASTVSPDEVVVTCVNPGMCKGTEMGRNMPWIVNAIAGIVMSLIARTVQAGARTYVLAAMAGKQCHGSFLSDGTIKPFPPVMYTEDGRVLQETMWKEVMEQLD